MQRQSINPSQRGLQFSMDQGEVVWGAKRHLRCSGQISAVPDDSSELGIRVVAPNDVGGQMECALANVEGVLQKAGMGRENILDLRFFTTEIELEAAA